MTSRHIITAECQAGSSILDRKRRIIFYASTQAAAQKALARLMKKYGSLYANYEIEELTR